LLSTVVSVCALLVAWALVFLIFLRVVLLGGSERFVEGFLSPLSERLADFSAAGPHDISQAAGCLFDLLVRFAALAGTFPSAARSFAKIRNFLLTVVEATEGLLVASFIPPFLIFGFVDPGFDPSHGLVVEHFAETVPQFWNYALSRGLLFKPANLGISFNEDLCCTPIVLWPRGSECSGVQMLPDAALRFFENVFGLLDHPLLLSFLLSLPPGRPPLAFQNLLPAILPL
jgi:hypothetical protein